MKIRKPCAEGNKIGKTLRKERASVRISEMKAEAADYFA